MSEELNPGAPTTPDVLESPIAETAEAEMPNYSEMSLAELSSLFEELAKSDDRMKKSKEAEAIKAAFYKRLSKEKAASGETESAVSEPDSVSAEEEAAEETENPAEETQSASNPFAVLENGFKAIYMRYKKERAEYNRQQEAEREDNLKKKQAVIDELKSLVENQDDLGTAFPAFRELQARWRAVGPVPVQNFRNINDTYQFYVEQFYDKVQINRDLRDLDFKKNLEAKEEFCQQAELLSENENIVDAFKELQKLHEQWKEFGPVAKEYRDQIWDRFKAATAVINKKYQAYFEEQKAKQSENLAAKTALCEKVEAIADKEDIKNSNEWNALSKEIEDIQKEWKTIGFASRKENQKIYDRFRAACDKFFGRKRDFYVQFKDNMNGNLEKKLAIIAEAEALKTSTEWKKTTDRFINLQNQWKEIGAVPRKKSEQLWKRFRAACDEFFAERDKHATPENNYGANLKAKKALIEEINSFVPSEEMTENEAYKQFSERWQAIGFVPFKEKEKIARAYNEAMKAKFGPAHSSRSARPSSPRNGGNGPKSEKDRLIAKYNKLQQDIDTYENNIGFFAMSKNSQPLIQQMQTRIEESKAQLKELENQIHALEEAEDLNNNE
ncbi:MAG: DUF349 domain-containing protein [Candidatus Cryptobacteroides sp.]